MITQPQSDIVLPEELSREVDKVKQQISINEIELVNIKKARISEEYTISELIKQGDYIRSQMEEITASIQSLNTTKSSIEEDIQNLTNITKEIELKNQQLSSLLDSREAKISEKELFIENVTADTKEGWGSLVKNKEDFVLQYNLFQEKSDKLDAFLKDFDSVLLKR